MTKKIIALLLIVASLFLLGSCSKKYKPVESTEEELRVMMTLSLDGDTYEVRYELYRALFLSYKPIVDGGNDAVWSSANASEYVNKIDDMIVNAACDIYSTLHHAKSLGIDPYSEEIEDKIYEYIEGSVNGYADSENTAQGFGGDYDQYLAYLRSMGLNYAVQVLLYRYGIVSDKIIAYYGGAFNFETPMPGFIWSGALRYTDEMVAEYYYSDNCVRILMAKLDTRSYTLQRANEIRNTIAGYTSITDVTNEIINHTITTPTDAIDGIVIGKYTLDDAYYSALTNAAFALSDGGTSQVIRIVDEEGDSYRILYRAEKNEAHFKEHIADIRSAYVSDEIGKRLAGVHSGLKASCQYSDTLNALNRATITYP